MRCGREFRCRDPSSASRRGQDMIAYFGKKLAESGHRISPDQIRIMTETSVADSAPRRSTNTGRTSSISTTCSGITAATRPARRQSDGDGYVKSSS